MRLSLSLSQGTAIILLLGLCLYLFHLFHSIFTGFPQYINWGWDAHWHLHYIRHIAQHAALPTANACFECPQPPLYYLIAAPFYRLVPEAGDPVLAVRLLSLGFYLFYLVFAVRLLRMEITYRPAYYAALCLVVFWPYGVIASGMVSNDPALFFSQSAALYYILRWRRDFSVRTLTLGMAWCGIATAFKFSGLLVSCFGGLVFVYYACQDRLRWRQQRAMPVMLCALLALAAGGYGFARVYHDYRAQGQTPASHIVPYTTLLERVFPVANDRLEYFLLPDVRLYFESPFLEQARHPAEMNYFINFVLKSSLYSAPAWRAAGPAYAMNLLSLAMLFYVGATLAAMLAVERKALQTQAPLLILCALQLAALISFRLLHPHTGHQNFRFVYLTLLAVALLYANCLTWHHARGRKHVVALGLALALLFALSSVSFFIVDSQLDPL